MNKILKIGLFLLLSFISLAIIAAIYIKIALPDVGPAPEMRVEKTDSVIKRGEYLANHVMVCMDCHSKRDWTKFSGPPMPGMPGMGGEVFDRKMGFPGKYVASNLTPSNLSDWTDGEIFRAVTSGVSKDGRALFPIMPHHNFGQLDEDDIKAVIAYLRTLKPIENTTEPSESDFPMNIIINTIPKKADLKPMPPKSDKAAYGKYLVTAAGCYDCHTKQEKGQFVGKPFEGGMQFPLPNETVIISPNITPGKSGIGNWTEEMFVNRFRMYANSGFGITETDQGDSQTVMPWTMYASMTEEDLKAIYAYLISLKATSAN